MPKDKRLDVLLDHMPLLCKYYDPSIRPGLCQASEAYKKGEEPDSTNCQGNIIKCELED